MGRKKSRRSHNQQRRQEGKSDPPSTFTQPTDNLVFDQKQSSKFYALSMKGDEFDKHIPTMNARTLGNVSLSTPKIELKGTVAESSGQFLRSSHVRNNVRYSSYHNLVDGGAYKDLSSKIATSTSDLDFESAGDRVLTGSRSISHKSLLSKSYNVLENKEVQSNNNIGREEKVRSYHAESLDRMNRFSQLSIYSNNDEFILIGGHPSYITASNGTIEKISHAPNNEIPFPRSHVPGSELKFSDGFDSIHPISKVTVSSQNSVETSSNTDERLKLAAEHSLSPEAEGLTELANTSINFYAHQSPQKALMVTSALTPLVPKRTQASHKTSDDSVNLEQPETVQRVKNIKQIRSLLYEPNRVGAETKEISVQTGNTIRLRQYSWTDVLSEYAYHPDFDYRKNRSNDHISCNIERSNESIGRKNMASSQHSDPENTEQSTEMRKNGEMSIENLSRFQNRKDSGNTLKKYVPKGRIRDLAAVFNNLEKSDKDQPDLSSLLSKNGDAKVIIKNDNVVLQKRSKLLSTEHSDFSTFVTFKSSTQNLNSHEERPNSTSSLLHCPPKVFTRNTFVGKDVNSSSLTGSCCNENSVNLTTTEKVPSFRKTAVNNMTTKFLPSIPKQCHPPVVDVPIRKIVSIEQPRTSSDRKRYSPIVRSKTQEVLPVVQFDSQYPIRALSGTMYDTDDLRGFPLTRKLFGNAECDHLVNEKEHSSELLHSIPCIRSSTIVNNPHQLNYKQNSWKDIKYPEKRELAAIAGSRHNMAEKEQKEQQLLTLHNIFPPPVTEDAGSRITHHTSTTVQEDPLSTEDSIRAKIDRMFAFVEGDDLGKHIKENNSSPSSVTLMGKSFRESAEETHRKSSGTLKEADCSETLAENDIEYSLSHYREIQREQLRRRLPSADEPQFFCSPSISVPHAGQRVDAYKTKEHLGASVIREKVCGNTLEIGFGSRPIALATSTPLDSPQSRPSYSPKYISEMRNDFISNETFVSSIGGASAFDNKTDFARKIDRLSYMIENTQKQMEMNEAALLDAIKKGRRMQEVAVNRSILITRETLRLQRNELRRLHAFSALRRPPPPMSKELRGSVIFRNLLIQLNKLFVSRLTEKDENSYSFVALFKFGHIVEATELVPLCISKGENTCEEIFFNKQIQFSDVPVDFLVTVEIYAMRLQPVKSVDISIGAALANKCKTLMGPPQKKGHAQALETAFKFRGRLVLDRDASGDRSFYLDDVTYPLEGTVRLSTVCSRLPQAFETTFSGFLTMFHTISNMASWERYWAVIRRGTVFFWKYPDDEQRGQEPTIQIDLTKCTNNMIEKCEFELCPRANSFAVDLLVDSDEDSIGSVVENKRVLLSTDSAELMAQWLFVMNQTLNVIRGPI